MTESVEIVQLRQNYLALEAELQNLKTQPNPSADPPATVIEGVPTEVHDKLQDEHKELLSLADKLQVEYHQLLTEVNQTKEIISWYYAYPNTSNAEAYALWNNDFTNKFYDKILTNFISGVTTPFAVEPVVQS